MAKSILPTLSVAQRGTQVPLLPGTNEVQLTEGEAFFTVSSSVKLVIYFNDIVLSCSWKEENNLCFFRVDLTNQVGFHRIRMVCIGYDRYFDFETVTAKATWAEIQQMANICAENYFGNQKQFTYLSKTGEIRRVFQPQVIFGWYRDRLPEIEKLIRQILTRPATENTQKLATSLKGKNVSVAATIKLLQEVPGLLEKSSTGPIQVGGDYYWPSKVRVRATEKVSALEHSKIAAFLATMICGLNQLKNHLHVSLLPIIEDWNSRLLRLRSAELFRRYPFTAASRMSAKTTLPSHIERIDSRYSRLRDLTSEYWAKFGEFSSDDTIRANIKDIWEIYQTFIGHVYGNAFGLNYSSSTCDLRRRSVDGASMTSDTMRLYFDHKPPAKYVQSWRDLTQRPANERPDLVVVNTEAKQILLLDAKFKVGKSRRQSNSADLFEMQSYMNSFNVSSGGIVYPGEFPECSIIEGKGNRLGDMPLRADFYDKLGSAEAVHRYIRASSDRLWCPLNMN